VGDEPSTAAAASHKGERVSACCAAVWRWIWRRRVSLSLLATAISLTVTFVCDPMGPVLHRLASSALWVIPTEIALDLAIGLGAGLMIGAATGSYVKSPIRAKAILRELPARANDNWIFKTGLLIATIAGVAWGGVAIVAVVVYLPRPAWGALIFPVLDLAVTVSLRRAIWIGMRQPSISHASSANTRKLEVNSPS
jgi:hypothetical protein